MRDYLRELAIDPTTSKWLKTAIESSRERDICDTLADVEALKLALERTWQHAGRQLAKDLETEMCKPLSNNLAENEPWLQYLRVLKAAVPVNPNAPMRGLRQPRRSLPEAIDQCILDRVEYAEMCRRVRVANDL